MDKEWSKVDLRSKRNEPSKKRDQLVFKRQTEDDACCVNGTKGEKGTQGMKYIVQYYIPTQVLFL